MSQKSKHSANPREDLLLKRLVSYFVVSGEYKKLDEILNGKGEHRLSMRKIDSFILNYAKEKNIMYELEKFGEKKVFNVYNEYKDALNGNKKQLFDTFCRTSTIYNISFPDKILIKTTPAVLNLLMWAIQNKVISYIETHYDEIYCTDSV